MNTTSNLTLLNADDFPTPPLLEEFKMLCVCMCLADKLVVCGEQDIISCLGWMAAHHRATEMAHCSQREWADYIYYVRVGERDNHDARGFNRYLTGQFEGWKMSADLSEAHGGPSASSILVEEINSFLSWAWTSFIEHEDQDK